MSKPSSDLEAGYNLVAEDYATEFFEELGRKPFDCALLDDFAADFRGQGVVYELGCGPGHVSRYLKDRGVDVHGLDLSLKMVQAARRLNPDITFAQGDMAALDLPDGSLAGVVLFYSIIHIEREDVTSALREMNRTLRPGGKLLMAFHSGEGKVHRDEWYGKPVSIDFRFFDGDEMAGYLAAAGFDEIRISRREPYEFEYPTHRCYLFATKPH